ncbi:MAG: HAD-IA family hydrolase [Betaproteobacteria bacterium]|nr:HAD-IA family hydrolase [Betaproteobacteria bacterium]
MLDRLKVKAITLDLDDTLWPIWPTIARAEAALQDWLRHRAPATAVLLADDLQRHRLRESIMAEQPDFKHRLSALRTAMIRRALQTAGEDTQLAEPAYSIFFEARQRVDLFEDAAPALEFLAQRYPVVALSNGNADVGRIGLAPFFRAAISAEVFGVGKPERAIFEAGAAAAGVALDEVLHIGDDASLDVLGALACGMQTVWVNREDHLWPHPEQPHETVSNLHELTELLR